MGTALLTLRLSYHALSSLAVVSTSAMISEGIKGRESLKLSFNRSISEPGHNRANMPLTLTPLMSPPSLTPSIHPPKRCRLEPSNFLMPSTVSLPTSPCSESNTIQRSLVITQTKTIDDRALADRLRKTGKHGKHFLLLDCRPFIAYNVSHIKGAINVNCCDRFNRKRLQQGKASLADLATTKEGKELLKKRTWKEVFVYDECSDSLENLPSSHTLFLVMNALVEDHREPIMLLGGLRDFQVSHRTLCEDHLMHNNNRPPNTVSSPSSKFLPDLPSPSDLCDTKDIETPPATQVLPHLYLGNMRDASDMASLSRLNIRYVLNVTAKPPSYHLPPGFHYKHLEAADNGLQNLRQFFEEAFNFIDEAKKAGAGVLVHCQAGISRSPTIAVAYLMKNNYPMAMSDAYKFVKTKRSIISPNLNFMGQLWEFEQVLNDEAKNAGGLINGPSTASVASASNTFMWSQSNDVSKSVDGIFASPQAMNGCSV